MNNQIKASNEGVHRVLRETNSKCQACMKEAGKQQNEKRLNKIESFYIILFFILILLVVLKVTVPIAVAVFELFF